MLSSIGHLAVAVVLGVLTVLAIRTWEESRRPYTAIVALVGAGLVYDNAVLGIGRWLGHGSVLEALSVPRFALHAFSTPLLVIVGYGALRSFGVRWAQRRATHAVACAVASALVVWGVIADLALLELDEQSDAGVVSYGNGAAGAPVPAIATIVALIVAGALLWRRGGWPWLALGATVMLVASGLGGVSGLLTNVGELSLVGALVATEREAVRRRPCDEATALVEPSRAAGPRV